MLEEMGQISSQEQDGKKVYTITREGLDFLEQEKESEERINAQMKRWWNPENSGDIIDTMREFDRLAGLVRDKVRNAESDKLSRMRKVLSQAYEDIFKD
jgi:DNA-binding PadR family transcriptional regulator